MSSYYIYQTHCVEDNHSFVWFTLADFIVSLMVIKDALKVSISPC